MDEALELWLGLGKDWSEFWTSTPRLVSKIIAAAQKQLHQNVVMQAWYFEYMARQKRLKGLSTYLKNPRDKKLLNKGEKMKAAPWLALFGPSIDSGKK